MFLNSTSEPLMPALTFPALTVAAAMLLTGNLPCQPWPMATAAAAHGPRSQARENEPEPGSPGAAQSARPGMASCQAGSLSG